MCNHIKANGEKCKKKSKYEYCHIHDNKISKREKILQDIVKLQQKQNFQHEEEMKLIKIVNIRNCKLYEDLLKKSNDLVDIYKSTEQDLIEAHEVNIKNEKLFDVTKNEVKNLNKTLEKKVLIIKSQGVEIEDLKAQLKTTLWVSQQKNETLLKEQVKSATLLKELKQKDNKIQELEEDATNYKFIKEYELEKQELINKGVNIYNYYNDEFHKNRQIRNVLAHRIK
jgi:hypothetical protein